MKRVIKVRVIIRFEHLVLHYRIWRRMHDPWGTHPHVLRLFSALEMSSRDATLCELSVQG